MELISKLIGSWYKMRFMSWNPKNDRKFIKSKDFDKVQSEIFRLSKKGYKLKKFHKDERHSEHFGDYKFYTAVMSFDYERRMNELLSENDTKEKKKREKKLGI